MNHVSRIHRLLRFGLIVACFCLPFVETATAATSQAGQAGSSLRKQVVELVRQLDSDSRKTRVAAERGLLKLGPEILPFLPAPELAPNVSVRETVRRVRVKLEREFAQHSVEPSRVTLTETFTLREILQAITKQTANPLDFTDLPKSALEKQQAVDIKKETFWSVVSGLEKQNGLEFLLTETGEALRVRKRTMASPQTPLAVNDTSAYRITVIRAEWKPLFGDDKHRLLRVRWSVTAEPRLRPLFLKYGGRSLTATLKDGTALAPYSPDAKYEVSATDQSRPIELHTDFLVPANATFADIRFRGKLQMLTAAGQEQMTFRNLKQADGSAIRRGGVTVTLQSARVKPDGKNKDASRLGIAIAVTYDIGGPAFESHRTWIFHNRAEIQLPGGMHIDREPGYKTELQRDGAVVVEYGFKLPAADVSKAEFVYYAPTLLIDVPIEFAFSRILVPKPERKSP